MKIYGTFAQIFLLLCLTIVAGNAFSETVYFRYNYLGYNPSREKLVVVMAEKNIDNNKWYLMDSGKRAIMEGGLSASLCGPGLHMPMPFNYLIDLSALHKEGSYTLETEGAQKATIIVKKNPYAGIMEKAVRRLYVAMSGSSNCLDHRAGHFGDTACPIFHRHNGNNAGWIPVAKEKKVDALGGWYDAGDYLKVTLTIAYSVYFLGKAYEINPGAFIKKYGTSDYVDVVDQIKWGCDYLCRCMPDTNEFIIMVGDNEDHNVGCRLPDRDELDGKRPALSALSQPQMAYAAAALAAGSQIFGKLGKKEIADRYRSMAERIYRRGVSKNIVPPAWLAVPDDGFDFYKDESPDDNLELAATEMFILTNQPHYLSDAKGFAEKARSSEARAWDKINISAHLELMNFNPLVKKYFLADMDNFLRYAHAPGNLWGVPFAYDWGSLYCYMAIGAAALEYEFKTGDTKFRSLGTNMLDYLMGRNNWGVFFIGAKEVPQSIKHVYSATYTLQARLFPEGAIAEGPCDAKKYETMEKFLGFDPTVEPTFKFNTAGCAFYDNKKDFLSMETCLYGVVDGIFMLALAGLMMAE
jgi:endoglucanase